MLKRALILAAGKGHTLVADQEGPNCLVEVGGVPLLVRTLRVLESAGIRRVGMTIGWRAPAMRRRLEELRSSHPELAALEISVFENPHWDKPNGLSLLAAGAFVTERTLLVMADQITAPGLVRELCSLSPGGDRTVLGVDRDLARVFDIDDATKVLLSGQTVSAIGKDLERYDAVSTGLFVLSPTLLDVLSELDEPSLTSGVHQAAARGLVQAHDVRGRLWQDVDFPAMKQHAEWLLRAYGDDLAEPAVRGTPPSAATDTLALIERLLGEKDASGLTLFNPGPVMTSARVKSALVHNDICHRDEDYCAVVRRLQAKLRPVFGASAQHEMLLLTGSGTAAMEMALGSAVPPGRKLLVISNGAFGERLAEIADLHNVGLARVACPWGEVPDPEDVRRALDADPEIAVVAMIHHETSVGLLNPVGAVGRLCRERGVMLIVDAVSTLGAEDVDVERDHIDICYSSANKCLHSVSGVSFLCVAPSVWERIRGIPPRVYYLDLARYRRYLEDLDQTPFTPAVSAFFALEAALDELAERGGVPARRELYRLRNLRIRRVLQDLGFASYTNTGRESATISTIRVPAFLTVDRLYAELKRRGFVIYRCKGALASSYVQVANMGELADSTIDAFLSAVTEVVAEARPVASTLPQARLRSV